MATEKKTPAKTETAATTTEGTESESVYQSRECSLNDVHDYMRKDALSALSRAVIALHKLEAVGEPLDKDRQRAADVIRTAHLTIRSALTAAIDEVNVVRDADAEETEEADANTKKAEGAVN
jgi:hypothetical protein